VAEGGRDRDVTVSIDGGDGERASPLACGRGKEEEGTGGRLAALWILRFQGPYQSVSGGKFYEPT
jgi:hypothetical protein